MLTRRELTLGGHWVSVCRHSALGRVVLPVVLFYSPFHTSRFSRQSIRCFYLVDEVVFVTRQHTHSLSLFLNWVLICSYDTSRLHTSLERRDKSDDVLRFSRSFRFYSFSLSLGCRCTIIVRRDVFLLNWPSFYYCCFSLLAPLEHTCMCSTVDIRWRFVSYERTQYKWRNSWNYIEEERRERRDGSEKLLKWKKTTKKIQTIKRHLRKSAHKYSVGARKCVGAKLHLWKSTAIATQIILFQWDPW